MKHLVNILILITSFFNAFSQNSYLDYLKLGKDCNINNGCSNEQAIQYLTKAIELNPECSECYFARARLWDESADRLSDFKNARTHDSNCIMCLEQIGTIYTYYEQKHVLARRYFKEALAELHCENETDYRLQRQIIIEIGRTYLRTNGGSGNAQAHIIDDQMRLSIWDSLIRTNPVESYILERASIRFDLGDYNGALNDYLEVYSEWKPDNSDIAWSIAGCYEEVGDYFQAIQFYSQAIKKRPIEYSLNNVYDSLDRLYWQRGICKLNIGDNRGALKDFNSALEFYRGRHPSLSIIHNSIAESKIRLNDFKGALIDLERAIELNTQVSYSITGGKIITNNSTAANSYYLRGMANLNLMKLDAACNDWSESGELGARIAYEAIQKHCK